MACEGRLLPLRARQCMANDSASSKFNPINLEKIKI
jgi:hypothetical protein